MSIDYQEWRPCDALNGVVLTYWSVVGDGTAVPSPMILPDAYVEIVINLGDAVTLVAPAFTCSQPPRSVVGLLESAVAMQYGTRVRTIGIRLHCARAAAFLRIPARALANTLTPLGELSEILDARLAQVMETHPQLESPEGRSALDSALVAQLRDAQPPDEFVTRAVDRLLEPGVPITVDELARELAISPRHLHRKFVEHVGTSPKHVERLARFARAWVQATMGPPLTWADLALANGYADQSHLIREFRAFGAQPPAHLFTAEWYDTTTVERA